MIARICLLTASLLLLTAQTVRSEEPVGALPNKAEPVSSDARLLVSMPDQARQLMREDMRNHLTALNEIYRHLGDSNFDQAAAVAERRMGKSSMGKHRKSGMGPGRFMPIEMRNIGWGMHEAASDFAVIAKQGDLKNAYSALLKVTDSCVACHYSYRTQ